MKKNLSDDHYTTLDVCYILGVSQETLRRWVKGKRFPPPVRVRSRLNWYLREDVHEFVKQSTADRQARVAEILRGSNV